MTDHTEALLQKFEIAQALLARCRRALNKTRHASHIGVTIIVHAVEPGPVDMHKAIASTLGDRQQLRIILADCLAEAMIADGMDPERDDFGKIAADDVARAYGHEPPPFNVDDAGEDEP